MAWAVKQLSSHGAVVVHQHLLQVGGGVASPAPLVTVMANGKPPHLTIPMVTCTFVTYYVSAW